MRSKKDSIALFGTSADPPTLGHQALLKDLATSFPKVITWASDNPDKTHGISLRKRSQLLRTLVKEISLPQLKLVQDLSSPWTINTLIKADKVWPNANFIFVIGSDLAEQVPKWLNAKSILRRANLGITIRDGWPIDENQLKEIEKLGGKVEVLPFKIPASSSSSFRNSPQETLIPKSIFSILLKENLYGISAGNKK